MICPACHHDLTTRGDVINARARAGAAVVDAREALARTPRKETAAHEAAAERLRQAESDYQAARAAEGAVT